MFKHLNLPASTRFAPSPSGDIHLGNLRSALFSWLLCQQVKGTFILRIEDTDSSRSDRSAVKSIVQSLRWVGITVGRTMFQSKRVGAYCRALKLLLILGKASPNFGTTDSDLDWHWLVKFNSHLPHIRSGTLPSFWYCCHQSLPAWLDLTRGSVWEGAKDSVSPLIVRTGGMPTFNFSSAVDDFATKTSHIVRGIDHLPNTAQQISLLTSVGRRPPKYFHLPMLLDPNQRKLSKRLGAKTVGHYAESGFFSVAIANFLVAGKEVTDSDLSCLAKECDLTSVGDSPVGWDARRLEQFNCLAFRHSSRTATWNITWSFLLRSGANVRTLLFSFELLNFVSLTTERFRTSGPLAAEFRRGFTVPASDAFQSQGQDVTSLLASAFEVTDWTKPGLTETIRTLGTGWGMTLSDLCSSLRKSLTSEGSLPLLGLVLASKRHQIIRHLRLGSPLSSGKDVTLSR